LLEAGAELKRPRYFEQNVLFDFAPPVLEKRDAALRLRRARNRAWLTYKGADQGGGRIKQREEYETELEDARAMEDILRSVGFIERFRYEKYRAVYSIGRVEVSLDEAPMGFYLELEGSPQEIESLARRMGFRMADGITATYPRLYQMYRDRRPRAPRFMVFPEKKESR
jgi:predicted adenylyl cyclase CyaB